MPHAQKLRLREALEDFINANGGEHGRGKGREAALVEELKPFLSKLSSPEGAEHSSPGRRAASEASGGRDDGHSANRVRELARELLGAPQRSGE
jgi:hypothetical protein